MTFSDDALDRLAPALPWRADWSDVLRRAGELQAGRRVVPRRLRKRRLVLALAVLAAVVIPLVAFAATSDWWFLKFGNAPKPLKAPVLVKEGEWSGHPWQLIAYPSSTDGLCLSVSPKGSTGAGAMGCGPFVGVSRTAGTKSSPDMTITYLAGSGGELPSYIVGPVIESAAEVEIRFANGHTLHIPTFAGPTPLVHINFYATQLSERVTALGNRRLPPPGKARGGTIRRKADVVLIKWLAGLDEDGNVVACLAPAKAKDGISPISDCR